MYVHIYMYTCMVVSTMFVCLCVHACMICCSFQDDFESILEDFGMKDFGDQLAMAFHQVSENTDTLPWSGMVAFGTKVRTQRWHYYTSPAFMCSVYVCEQIWERGPLWSWPQFWDIDMHWKYRESAVIYCMFHVHRCLDSRFMHLYINHFGQLRNR